ncbi:MAG: sulfatase [Myxococcota bacterium]
MSRALPLLLALLTLAPACAPAPPGPPRAVFLLVVDTLRADHLGCYGGRFPTPHVDGLAGRGVRFEQAQAVAGWTVPSMGALFTSRWPRELDLLERPAKRALDPFDLREQGPLRLRGDVPHLAARLRDAGYRTAGFVDQPMLRPDTGFARGFDDYFEVAGHGVVRRFVASGSAERAGWDHTPHAYDNDRALVERFTAWLADAPADARLFAWLHLLTPHTPYRPPPEFAEGAPGPLTPAAYAGEVRAADALVGRALAAIDRHVGLEHALVVFTSDHGESLGDHGEVGHGQTLHAEVMRVPLLLAGAGVPEGRVVAAPARTLDIAPTLLERVGLEIPESFRGTPLLGPDAAPATPVLAEGVLYGPSEQAWIEDGYKLLLSAPGASAKLFSLDTDPDERTDLAPDEPERVARLRARLGEMRAALHADPPPPGAGPSAEDREALRALGYVDDAPDPR